MYLRAKCASNTTEAMHRHASLNSKPVFIGIGIISLQNVGNQMSEWWSGYDPPGFEVAGKSNTGVSQPAHIALLTSNQ